MSRTVNKQKPRFNKKKNRRVQPAEEKQGGGWWMSIRRFLSFSLSLVALVGIGAGLVHGWESLNQSPRVRVAAIEVEGISRISRGEIDAYLGGVYGSSIFELDLDNLAYELRRHPWISEVSVRRKLPDALMIQITEHTPGIFVSLNEVYVANKDGDLFKRLSSRDGLLFPVLTGLDLDATEFDSYRQKGTVKEAIEIVETLEKYRTVFGRVEEIHFDGDLGWSIVTRSPNKNDRILRTHLGITALRRITVARDVLNHLKEIKRDPEVIWVDGVKNPDRIHVRLRAARSIHDAERFVASAR